jgi:multiple sugar transport system permease protein
MAGKMLYLLQGEARVAPRKSPRRRLVKVTREISLNLIGCAVVGALVFPVYWAVCVAFQSDPTPLIIAPRLIPLHLIFGNVSQAFGAETSDIMTSLIVSCSAVAVGIAVGLPAAYALKRFRVRYTAAVIGVLLVTQMVPSISLSIAFYSLFDDVHLLNSYVGLILADSTYAVPLMVLLLRAFMESMPGEILEAARLDGCSEIRCMISVVTPVAVPGIVTAALFGFLGAWGDFLFGLTLNGGSSVQPVTLGLYKFVTVYTNSWGPIMATVVLAAIPAAVIISIGQRWIRSGLRAGSLQ